MSNPKPPIPDSASTGSSTGDTGDVVSPLVTSPELVALLREFGVEGYGRERFQFLEVGGHMCGCMSVLYWSPCYMLGGRTGRYLYVPNHHKTVSRM
ncbi:hypothetical protein KIPB_010782 [Kipferlia bialata]|uniref:Uncharacterized protein n=1 Tax=Kipferlia bialata TaxID=797122 RepID=A0A391NUC1_9EUKA|nr:hypothetical protein KIPB_010782 [Kipferlia bialata]|eukprot:g10782.t1